MAETGHETLAPNLVAAALDGGRIAENIVRFARILRAAGLPIGPDRTVLATRAAMSTGLQSMAVFKAALRACLTSRPEHNDIFDEAFRLFWKEPLAAPDGGDASGIEDHSTQMSREVSRRLLESLLAERPRPARQEPDEFDVDARDTFNAEEILRHKDFDQMSAAELREARRAIASIPLVTEVIRTRRYKASRHGERIDLRAVLRTLATKGPDHMLIARKTRIMREVPIVVLVDISGSMDSYARMMLHFLYALANARTRVRAFLFGTRLTNVTRQLAGRDPDKAIDEVARSVSDWAGGTRIGESITTFNRLWARRVLGQNATVLLITDGLDRGGGADLEIAARRLRSSCRRLVWLNPLLRYDGYQPLARGAQALNRHVSERYACHNLHSLEDLARALGGVKANAAKTRRRGSRL